MSKNVSVNPKTCAICGKTYRPTSNRQRNCVDCREAYEREKNKERCTARFKRTYVHKGYNQAGENNNAWKGGIYGEYYQRIAFEHYGKACTECGATENICVHHRDENRYNNKVENLNVLCRSCHAKVHDLHKNFLPSEKV